MAISNNSFEGKKYNFSSIFDQCTIQVTRQDSVKDTNVLSPPQDVLASPVLAGKEPPTLPATPTKDPTTEPTPPMDPAIPDTTTSLTNPAVDSAVEAAEAGAIPRPVIAIRRLEDTD